MSHIDQSAFRRIADSLPTPTASIAPKAEGEARKLPSNAREWTDSESAAFREGWGLGRKEGLRVAPVAQAAVGASESDLRAALKDALEFIEYYSRHWNGVSAKHPNTIAANARAALSSRPEANADRASGGGATPVASRE